MHIFQTEYVAGRWSQSLPVNSPAQWVLVFGNPRLAPPLCARLRQSFPQAAILGCSTSGEIQGTRLLDDSLCVTAVTFKHSPIHCVSAAIQDYANSYELAVKLARKLPSKDLRHVFVISDGELINGSELVKGFSQALPPHVMVTGGLAGDGTDFTETHVWHNDHQSPGLVVITGFYGSHIHIGHGHLGGWEAFGPEWEITRAHANELYEIDGRPALDLYKEYLGEASARLPSSALLFPMAITPPQGGEAVVRTILAIDNDKQLMRFAGDMPVGSRCRFMRSNYGALIEGATGAAESALHSCSPVNPELALLISCVGRRLVLAQRTEEELEVVAEKLHHCPMTGFYSYGEISPLIELGKCGLHNQTMTITLLAEQ